MWTVWSAFKPSYLLSDYIHETKEQFRMFEEKVEVLEDECRFSADESVKVT